jgi:hypothetical protein
VGLRASRGGPSLAPMWHGVLALPEGSRVLLNSTIQRKVISSGVFSGTQMSREHP